MCLHKITCLAKRLERPLLTDSSKILLQTISGQTLHRRHFVKRDGRDLFLYGYNPHSLSPLPEDAGEVAKGVTLHFLFNTLTFTLFQLDQ